MATQDDIHRLDHRIDQERSEFNHDIQGIRTACLDKHNAISLDIKNIQVTLARIEERQVQAYGELGAGTTLFADHAKRLNAIEKQLSNWKGWFAGLTAAASIGAGLVTAVVKIVWIGLSKL